MENNEHSIKVWELICKYASQWNVRQWRPYNDKIVAFAISNYNFSGAISIQEITNPMSPKYGLFLIAFQDKRAVFPTMQFLAKGEVTDFIDSFCQLNWGDVKGERAPVMELCKDAGVRQSYKV